MQRTTVARDVQDEDIEAGGDLLEKACVYITEGRYPEDATANDKMAIRRKAARFTFCEGELLYKKAIRGVDGKKVKLGAVLSSSTLMLINHSNPYMHSTTVLCDYLILT